MWNKEDNIGQKSYVKIDAEVHADVEVKVTHGDENLNSVSQIKANLSYAPTAASDTESLPDVKSVLDRVDEDVQSASQEEQDLSRAPKGKPDADNHSSISQRPYDHARASHEISIIKDVLRAAAAHWGGRLSPDMDMGTNELTDYVSRIVGDLAFNSFVTNMIREREHLAPGRKGVIQILRQVANILAEVNQVLCDSLRDLTTDDTAIGNIQARLARDPGDFPGWIASIIKCETRGEWKVRQILSITDKFLAERNPMYAHWLIALVCNNWGINVVLKTPAPAGISPAEANTAHLIRLVLKAARDYAPLMSEEINTMIYHSICDREVDSILRMVNSASNLYQQTVPSPSDDLIQPPSRDPDPSSHSWQQPTTSIFTRESSPSDSTWPSDTTVPSSLPISTQPRNMFSDIADPDSAYQRHVNIQASWENGEEPQANSFSDLSSHLAWSPQAQISRPQILPPAEDYLHPVRRQTRWMFPDATQDTLFTWWLQHAGAMPSTSEMEELTQQTGVIVERLKWWFIEVQRIESDTLHDFLYLRSVEPERALDWKSFRKRRAEIDQERNEMLRQMDDL